MTIEQTIQLIRQHPEYIYHDIVLEALKKQAPMKAIVVKDYAGYDTDGCPVCKRIVDLLSGQKYCANCGQRLEVSDDD